MLRRNYLSEVRWFTGLGRRFLCCVAGSMHAVSLTLFSRLDRKVVYQLREIGAMTVVQKIELGQAEVRRWDLDGI